MFVVHCHPDSEIRGLVLIAALAHVLTLSKSAISRMYVQRRRRRSLSLSMSVCVPACPLRSDHIEQAKYKARQKLVFVACPIAERA